MESIFMTVAEMQDYLKISRCQAYALIKKPGFPPLARVGRQYLINKQMLNDWLYKKEGEEKNVQT